VEGKLNSTAQEHTSFDSAYNQVLLLQNL
jgi:hypothetical protein